MASILKIADKWRALVRRKGHPHYCRTFSSKAQAEAWARQIEADIDRGQSPPAAKIIGKALLLRDVITAYRDLRDRSRPISDASNEHYMLR
ncbi:MAG: site-specific integrase, partial [Rubrivivax sp.]